MTVYEEIFEVIKARKHPPPTRRISMGIPHIQLVKVKIASNNAFMNEPPFFIRLSTSYLLLS